MTGTVVINCEARLLDAYRMLDEQYREHRYIEVEVRKKAGTRTLTQNRALHKFCALLAETLNDAGYDMKRVIKEDVDIPWSTQSVKDYLWRPIQKALTDKDSTTEITTVEPSDIHAVLTRHLGDKLGVEVPPWPTREAA